MGKFIYSNPVTMASLIGLVVFCAVLDLAINLVSPVPPLPSGAAPLLGLGCLALLYVALPRQLLMQYSPALVLSRVF